MGPLSVWFERRIVPPLRRFGDAPAMIAIRDALPISFAGLLAGALGFVWFVPAPTIAARLLPAVLAGFSVMAIVLLVLLAYRFARRLNVPPFGAVPLAAVVFAFSLPQPYGTDMLSLATRLGPSGLLLAIIIALVSVGAIAHGRRLGGTRGAWIAALIVLAAAVTLFLAHVSPAALIADAMRPLGTLGDSLVAFVLIIAIETFLWTAGIHGPALLAGVVTPVYLALQFENTHASAVHQPLPHIVTTSLFLYAFPGGAGATLPLVLMLLRSKNVRVRKVAYASILPAIFNMNEPLLFGLPIVMNPIMAIPFIAIPCVLAIVSYSAVALNLVARPLLYIPSTVPGPIAVFAATGDWRAVVLLAVDLLISAALYVPFLRIYERSLGEA